MAIDPHTSGSRGGKAAAERMTPEQRRERASRANLASSVNRVARDVHQLTGDQIEALRVALSNR